MTYTPGPWKYIPDSWIVSEGGKPITMAGMSVDDAHLIAAAPTLLEALLTVQGWFLAQRDFGVPPARDADAIRQTVRAAIALATGETK